MMPVIRSVNPLSCPNCGRQAAHWEPDSIGARGHFVCEARELRSWQIRLDFTRPPKGLSANDRAHWRTKAKSTALVRGLVAQRVRYAGVPKLGRCRVDVQWIVTNARTRDPDNLAPLTKAIYDAIGSNRGVGARIVEDDDPAHMEKPQATILVDHNEDAAYFVITITDITEEVT